jgi:extracellular elastinolytic metalloproteinase
MSSLRTRRATALAAVAGVAAALSLSGMPTLAATPLGARGTTPGMTTATSGAGAHHPRIASAPGRDAPGSYDVRRLSMKAAAGSDRQRISSEPAGVAAYQRSLGQQSIIDYDPLTKTVRSFGRIDGYLSGTATGSARAIALRYVRAHVADLGLVRADLASLVFRQDYVDAIGVHNLSWTQAADGTTLFGNGLKVKVTRDGRVLDVQGSPVSHLARLAAAAPSSTSVSAAQARSRAASDVGGSVDSAATSRTHGDTTTWSNHDYAQRVWFLTPGGLRPAWSTYVHAGDQLAYQHVIDAVDGTVLYRASTVRYERGDAYVYNNYPGARRGGHATTVNLIKRGFLRKGRKFLNGTSVVAWSDVNDDNRLQNSEKTPVPGNKSGATFKLKHFGNGASQFCSAHFVCTWNPHKGGSWKINRKADVTQAFYLASNFHHYLAKAPIKFTPKAGNFSAAGGDPVLLNSLDGASTAGNMPDGDHIDNANMDTPPDGIPPTMQMYLFHFPGAPDFLEPFVPTTGSFAADVLYHEYTHGLSSRLVTDAQGNETLDEIQPGSMGEAWSDYYAMDYLVTKGYEKDTRHSGELLIGKYVAHKAPIIRTMAIDCARRTKAKGCRAPDGSHGGYTYGDFPSIIGFPEVHASGEIWGQTLWDVRSALGHRVADTLITRAMSLSPTSPTFLDMRNAIIQADLVAYRSSHTARLWKIFAHRGMGYFAGAIDGTDGFPAQDFHTVPAPWTPRVTVRGTVTDPHTGDPVSGVLVTLGGQGERGSAVTDAAGNYSIRNVYRGTYKKATAGGGGYTPDSHKLNTRKHATEDFLVSRDWAAASGGASVADYTGPDFTDFGCGPAGAIDLSLGSGWGSTALDDAGDPSSVFVPKYIVIRLPNKVNVSTFAVDPSPECGDDPTSATGRFEIDTSPNGAVWTKAAEGTFGSGDIGRLNTVTPTAGTGGVGYVKFQILGDQVPNFATDCPDSPVSGCVFADMTELEVFGNPVS